MWRRKYDFRWKTFSQMLQVNLFFFCVIKTIEFVLGWNWIESSASVGFCWGSSIFEEEEDAIEHWWGSEFTIAMAFERTVSSSSEDKEGGGFAMTSTKEEVIEEVGTNDSSGERRIDLFTKASWLRRTLHPMALCFLPFQCVLQSLDRVNFLLQNGHSNFGAECICRCADRSLLVANVLSQIWQIKAQRCIPGRGGRN